MFSQDFPEDTDVTLLWNTISYEFIGGFPKNGSKRPTDTERNLIDSFLNAEAYAKMMSEYSKSEIINETLSSHIHNTTVIDVSF